MKLSTVGTVAAVVVVPGAAAVVVADGLVVVPAGAVVVGGGAVVLPAGVVVVVPGVVVVVVPGVVVVVVPGVVVVVVPGGVVVVVPGGAVVVGGGVVVVGVAVVAMAGGVVVVGESETSDIASPPTSQSTLGPTSRHAGSSSVPGPPAPSEGHGSKDWRRLVGLGVVDWLARGADRRGLQAVMAGNLVVQILSLGVVLRTMSLAGAAVAPGVQADPAPVGRPVQQRFSG